MRSDSAAEARQTGSGLGSNPISGLKLVLRNSPEAGIGEIAEPVETSESLQVAFFITPARHLLRHVKARDCTRAELPLQTRCYFLDDGVCRNGRIVGPAEKDGPVWSYPIKFPNQPQRLLAETDFRVRSGHPTGDPTETLAELAHETPFFFELRARWISEYVRQVRLAGGLTGPLSAPIDLYPHQIEVVRRVLRDPEVRYLLADEVGLGKTIEAGLILRQLRLDAPSSRIAVYVPEPLVSQWCAELARLGLKEVPVSTHAKLVGAAPLDVAIIDEAHRVVADEAQFTGARALCADTRHVLLLSATPVLHHEREMLALLHLLSPHAYRLQDLDAFRERVRVRSDLGRVLLALSTASSQLVLKSQLRRLADLLPNDPAVATGRELVDNGAAPEQVRAEAAAVHTHVSETYRLYRRMLRSRRAALIADGSVPAERRLQTADARDDPAMAEAWSRLEDWRTILAADSPESEEAATVYIGLGGSLGTDAAWCAELVAARIESTESDAERAALHRLLESIVAPTRGPSRIDRLVNLLFTLGSSDRTRCRKYVVFCDSTSVCDRIAQACSKNALGSAVAHSRRSPLEIGDALRRFREDPHCSVLIGDRTAEEGLNLTFAYRVILFDLPFEPLRLEQRLGRLDRLTRVDDVNIHVLPSHADTMIALDAAWLRVLDAGFGVFARSASDVQIVIHRETERLKRLAFIGGPSALANETAAVAAAVEAERREADEQDAIDGLQTGGAASSAAYRGLCEADRTAKALGEAIRGYWCDAMRLDVRPARPNVVEYGIRRGNLPPLVPLDRFREFQSLTNRPSTVNRGAALEDSGTQFIRPGHAFADSLWRLAEWDDRGRAYALWREMPGQLEPRFVFRIAVLTGLELKHLAERLSAAGYDELARANLLRLVGSWFPARYDEVFLDERGEAASTRHADYCRENYDNEIDKNLSDDDSAVLTRLLGAEMWPVLCRRARDAALEAVTQTEEFHHERDRALAQAADHFRTVRARLRARAGTAESAAEIHSALAAEDRLEAAVLELIRAPLRTCDSIGFYLLSETRPETSAT